MKYLLLLLSFSLNATQITTKGIANLAVTDAKVNDVSMAKVTSGTGFYFSYKPNGVECADGESLVWVAATDRWICGSGGSGASTSLNNLVTTSINQSLIPNTAYVRDLGTPSLPWNIIYGVAVYGDSSSPLQFSSQGNNINLLVNSGKAVTIESNGASAAIPLRFLDADSSAYVSFKSAAIVPSNVNWTWPSTDSTGTQCLVSNGSGVLSWSSCGGSSFPILAPAGSVSAPSYSFSGDTDTGFYSAGADNIKVSAGATDILDIGSTGVAVTGGIKPSIAGTYNTGESTLPWGDVYSNRNNSTNGFKVYTSGFGSTVATFGKGLPLPDGSGDYTGIYGQAGNTDPVGIGAGDDVSSGSQTKGVQIQAQNNTGAGDGGYVQIRGGNSSSGNGGGVKIITPGTQPTCASGTRGIVWHFLGGTGVADKFEVCAKSSTNVYSWYAMATIL